MKGQPETRARVVAALVAAAIVIAAVWTLPALADIYRWHDASGGLHFGDNPPAGVDATRITPQSNSIDTGNPQATEKRLQKQIGQQDRQQQKAHEAARQQQRKQQQCRQLHQRLTALENHPRILLHEKNGNTRRLTEEQRQARIKRLRKEISANCPGS
ncbi:MAG TPA: DUF4124 domain-containing protein [Gammaproteobacteria bacterium]|nr:DUF4124 domain-containing protein [Gammaproteobacteria bacterium]